VSQRLAQKEETRARILDSAVELFESDEGEVLLKDVAEHAGVSIPTILFHYGSRFGLLQAVAEVLVAENTERWPDVASVRSTDEAMDTLLHLQRERTSRSLWRVGDEISWLVPQASEPVAERFTGWLRDHLLRDGYPESEADRLADVLAPGLMMVIRRLRVNEASEALAERFLSGARDVLARWPAPVQPETHTRNRQA
jgi:AcrR family transcriptional regulator